MFVPHDVLRGVLASAAGTVFEAAPFVVGARLLPRTVRGIAIGAGCGCGSGAIPGALAPAAFALCWIAFGPAAAVARAAAAATVAIARSFARRRRGRSPCPTPSDRRIDGSPGDDPFAELARLGGCAALASGLCAAAAPFHAGPLASAALGCVLGALAPCATAGVAIASGFAPHAPVAAAAILATSGVAPPLRGFRLRSMASVPGADGRFATFFLALVLGALSVRGPSGLVSPRIVPLGAAGAIAAVALGLKRPRGHPASAAVPAGLLAALIAGASEPRFVASEVTAASGFPGERATVTGSAHGAHHGDRAATDLVRFAITCCRVDATAVDIPLDRRLPVRDGSWVTATGALRVRNGVLALAVERWRSVPAPADPFVYR